MSPGMKTALLWYLVTADVSRGSRDKAVPFDGADGLVSQIRSKADAMLSEFAARAGAGTEPADNVEFNETFFTEKCDLTEYTTESYDDPKYQFSGDAREDDSKWIEAMKCVDPGTGAGQVFSQNGFYQGRHECASLCNTYTKQTKGEVMCCMYHENNQLCVAYWGWQGMQTSDWGTNDVWKFFNRRKPKLARLMMTPSDLGEGDLSNEGAAMNETQEGQGFVKELIHQVNAVSIDGILDHLLSFYICIRWVPDNDFIKLAKFELEHVSVDSATPAEGPRTREDIFQKLLQADITPLRCGSAINVQHMTEVDRLMNEFNSTDSDLFQLYSFSKKIWQTTDGGLFQGLFLDEMRALDEAMKFDATSDDDSVYVQDMRQMARKSKNLPWMTFLRSSNDFDHHFSSSDNLFMLCFGPRVASFPHKRENGQHVMADGNMAGCNGFWDFDTMEDQINRIKKLFAPEMCFEHTLRKELKNKFLSTFVAMNLEFELAMQNRFSKRVHSLDPTKDSALDLLSGTDTGFDKAAALRSTQTKKEYKKVAHLVANAAAKWVVCPAQADYPSAAFGNEDNFYRNPDAYKKWIGEVNDETVPQCKTFDPITGCVKCVVAVMDEFRCHVRLNVTLDDVFKAIRDKQYPFLASRFTTEEEVETEGGSVLREVTKSGACMVRKSVATAVKADESGDIQDVRDAYFNVNSTDTIVHIVTRKTPASDQFVETELRNSVSKRQKAYAQFVADGGVYDPTVTEKLVGAVTEETYLDKAFDWQKKFIFTHEEPEEQNRPAHKVDYFMSCPCTVNDFSPSQHFAQFGGMGMGEYYNFR